MDQTVSLYKGNGRIFSVVPSLFMLYRDSIIFVIIVTMTIILPGTVSDVGKTPLETAIRYHTSFLTKLT